MKSREFSSSANRMSGSGHKLQILWISRAAECQRKKGGLRSMNKFIDDETYIN